jgi:hypothetical protein
MPAAIMPIELSARTIELSARTIVTVAVVVAVAAYVNAEALSASYCWRCDGYGSKCGQSVKELSHEFLLTLLTEENKCRRHSLRGTPRNFFEYMFTIIAFS